MVSAISGVTGQMSVGAMSRPPKMSSDEMWNKMDADGDGQVTKSELEAFMADAPAGPNGEAPDIDDLFSEVDSNGDGVITKDEHEAQYKKFEENMKAQANNLAGIGSNTELNKVSLAQLLAETLSEEEDEEDSTSSTESTTATTTATKNLLESLNAYLTSTAEQEKQNLSIEI